MSIVVEPTVAPVQAGAASPRPRRALLGWVAIVAIALVWGEVAVAGDARQALRAAPLAGRWVWHATWTLLPALAFGGAIALAGPRIAARARWRRVPVLAGAAASTWTVLMAASDGWTRIAAPLSTRHEYVPFATTIDGPAAFVRTFTERASLYPTHVKGHPPGATLAFWLLGDAGLDGSGWAAALVILGWGIAVASTVVAVAELAGRAAARRAAPFVVLLPAVVWAGTSADALFAGVAATGVALVVIATGRGAAGASAAGLFGGATLAGALHLTYGAVPLLAIPAAVVVWRRRFDVLVAASVGAALVTTAWVSAGFWWLDGLEVTRAAYWGGVAARRPWPYYVVAGNPAALALAVGPAVAVAAGHARRRATPTWLLAAAALGAVVVADLSVLSKGEVERIWLPYVPWLATVAALLPRHRERRWLLLQVGVAVVLQAWLRSPW